MGHFVIVHIVDAALCLIEKRKRALPAPEMSDSDVSAFDWPSGISCLPFSSDFIRAELLITDDLDYYFVAAFIFEHGDQHLGSLGKMLDSFLVRSDYAKMGQVVHSTCGALTTLFLTIRLWARSSRSKRGLWWDDYLREYTYHLGILPFHPLSLPW